MDNDPRPAPTSEELEEARTQFARLPRGAFSRCESCGGVGEILMPDDIEYFHEENQDWDNESQIPGLVHYGGFEVCASCLGDGITPTAPRPPDVDGILYLRRYLKMALASWPEPEPGADLDDAMGDLDERVVERRDAAWEALVSLDAAVEAFVVELELAEVARARNDRSSDFGSDEPF